MSTIDFSARREDEEETEPTYARLWFVAILTIGFILLFIDLVSMRHQIDVMESHLDTLNHNQRVLDDKLNTLHDGNTFELHIIPSSNQTQVN